MKNYYENEAFWEMLNDLINSQKITVDRPKGESHPIIKSIIYPVDYGYIENTKSSDNEGIDIWVGTARNGINGIICTYDSFKRDSEIKVLYNCSKEEINTIYTFTNQRNGMKGILLLKS